MKSKKAAMEMSVGTIVTIVLLMSVLILGLFLVRNIFGSAKGAVDLTDQQLQGEIAKAFGSDDAKVLIYPTSRYLEIKTGKLDAVGLGIRNVASTMSQGTEFTYKIVHRSNSCQLTPEQATKLFVYGTEGSLTVPIGSIKSDKLRLEVPTGYPTCVIKYGVNINRGTESYDSDIFEVEIKA